MTKKKILIFNDTSISLHIGCELVVNNLHNEIEKRGHIINKTFPVSLSKFDIYYAKNAIKKCDVVIINGEGTLHDGNGEYLLCLGSYAKNLGKKVHLINCVYQNNPNRFSKYIKQFDSILVRESNSQNNLKNTGVQSTIVPDLTFITDTSELHSDKKREGIAFSDSVLPNVTEVLIKKCDDDREYQYIPPFLKRNYKNIKNIYNRNIIFLSTTNTKQIIKYFLAEIRNLVLHKKKKNIFASPNQYINTLLSSEKIIAGRFHTVCLCILTKTPFVAIESNTYKISGLLEDVGSMQDRIINLNEKDILISDFNKSELKNIDEYLACAKKEWSYFFDSL